MTDKDSNILSDFNANAISGTFSSRLLSDAKTEKEYVPALRTNHAALYKTILYALKPRKILEAGTLFGYSSILAAEVLSDVSAGDFRIDTVELDRDNVDSALKNIKDAGFSKNVRVIPGDACEVFSCLEGPYDLIFLDCSKSSYNELLPDVKRLLRKGGMLLADDVVYHGKLEGEDGVIPHKHRTIVNSLTEFLTNISNDSGFSACLDTMDDGLLLAVKL